ncbi:hypothetical protein OIO90_004512 [Microbotryomycetes sp. JL221]|nr:hypothetical protein OIO90_004512 [Microbotryomycetes sp. JL221]
MVNSYHNNSISIIMAHDTAALAQRQTTRQTTQQQVEQSHKAARLASTLRLKAAWSDIAYRHSNTFVMSSNTTSSSNVGKLLKRGSTRALLEDEDDIVDLETMEIVQDRGVLRRAKQGAFQIGGQDDYDRHQRQRHLAVETSLHDESTDVDVTTDDDDEEDDSRSSSTTHRLTSRSHKHARSAVDAHAHYYDDDNYDDDKDEDDESEDELAAIDELPSLPSVKYREQRIEAEERRLELLEFSRLETEARAIRASTNALGRNDEECDDEEWARTTRALESSQGNEVLEWNHLPTLTEEQEEDELAEFVVTPTTTNKGPKLSATGRPCPPSTLHSLRQRFGSVQLEMSSPLIMHQAPSRVKRSQSVVFERKTTSSSTTTPTSTSIPYSKSMPSLASDKAPDWPTKGGSRRDATPVEWKPHNFSLSIAMPRGMTPVEGQVVSHQNSERRSRSEAPFKTCSFNMSHHVAVTKYPTPPEQRVGHTPSSSPLKRTRQRPSLDLSVEPNEQDERHHDDDSEEAVIPDSEDELSVVPQIRSKGTRGCRPTVTTSSSVEIEIVSSQSMPTLSLATPPNSKASQYSTTISDRSEQQQRGVEPDEHSLSTTVGQSPTKRRRRSLATSAEASTGHIVPGARLRRANSRLSDGQHGHATRQLATPPVSRGSDRDRVVSKAETESKISRVISRHDATSQQPVEFLDDDDQQDELGLAPVDSPIKLEPGMIEQLWPIEAGPVMNTTMSRRTSPRRQRQSGLLSDRNEVDVRTMLGEQQRTRSERAGSVLHLLPSSSVASGAVVVRQDTSRRVGMLSRLMESSIDEDKNGELEDSGDELDLFASL